jgi:Domain of unknown function (DUF4129)
MTTRPMAAGLRIDIQQTPSQSQAQQMAASELANPKYHDQPGAQSSVTSLPTIPTPSITPTPTPPPSATNTSSANVILVILGSIALVLILVFVLRAISKFRKKDKKEKTKKDKPKTTRSGDGPPSAFDEVLTGAALHRRTAENAAAANEWAEAIRERFRAVISTLDELGLLPERPERTADEAARDAGEVLPEHRQALAAAALAFDEVEYGEYVGGPDGYARIRAVDEQITARATAGRTGPRR